MLFSSLYALAHSSSSNWCLVFSSFLCISSSSLLLSNHACSSHILVSISISNFFILSSRLCFAEDVSETFSVSWPLAVAPFLHCLSNWVVRWVVVIALTVVHCFSCVALLCIHCWLRAFAYIFQPILVRTCFALPCLFQMFFNKISLMGHKLVLMLQLLGYFSL